MIIVPGIVTSSKGESQSIVTVLVVITDPVVDCVGVVGRVVASVVLIGVVGLLVVVWIVGLVVVIIVVWTVVGWVVDEVVKIIVVSDVYVEGWGIEMVGTIVVGNVAEDVVPRVVVWKFLVLWVVDVIVVIMDAIVTVVVV